MTDTLNVDAPENEGAGDDQSTVLSGQEKSIAGAPQSSQELLELRKEVALTRSELKGLQGRQDKDKNEIQRFMEDVKAHVANGLSLEQAEDAVSQSRKAEAKDDLLYKMAQKMGVLDDFPQNGAGNANNAADDVAKVFASFEVPLNIPEATSLFGLRGTELELAVSKLALKRAKQLPPDSSEAGALRGGPPSPPGGDDLIKKYQRDMTAAQGNPSLARSIKAEAIKKGVPVDSVVFH